MREKQGRGGRRNAQGGDGETHIFRDGRTDGQTDGQTDTGSYRSGAHLKTRILPHGITIYSILQYSYSL